MGIEDLFDIDTLREDFDMEFKKALGKDGNGKLPESFWESYSAMANTEGGYIILGIAEEKDGLNFIGIPNREKVVKELWDLLNNSKKISCNLLVDRDVMKRSHKGADLIIIQVPQATRKQKPIYIGTNPLTGTYRRNNEGDYKCPKDIVQQMLGEQVNDTNDSVLLGGFTLEDVNVETLKTYRQHFTNRKPTHPFNDFDDEGFLQQIGGFAIDRKTHKESLTLAGLLMFGKLRSILDVVPNFILDYQEQVSVLTEAGPRWLDRVTTDFEWSGNVYDFYRIVIKKLTEGLKVPFVLEGDIRVEDTQVHEALREALVNTLIHTDYSARCSILVVKRADIFGFRNPGLIRMPIADALRGGTSDCRNRNLQKMFQLIGLGEQAGSGIPKIYQNWKQQNWRSPKFEQKFEANQTIMVLRMLSLFPEEVVVQIKDQMGEKNFDALNETEQMAIVLAKTDSGLSHARLKELTDEHPKDLTDILHGLVQKGFLQSRGRGRGTVYYLPGEIPSMDTLTPEVSAGGFEQKAQVVSQDGQQIESQLQSSTSPVQVQYKSLKEGVLKLLQKGPASAAILSKKFGQKRVSGQLRAVLKEVKSDLLIEFTIPKKPNSSLQKYRLTQKGIDCIKKIGV
ncbi:RNA-binding domain-containing protein [Candidatus Omnitrophota bacterium]